MSVSMPITGCVALRLPFRFGGTLFASKRLSHERFVIKQNVRVRKVLEIKWKKTGMSGESEEETINLVVDDFRGWIKLCNFVGDKTKLL